LTALIEAEDFKSWMRGKASLHRPQSGYSSISYRLTPTTLVALAVRYERERTLAAEARCADVKRLPATLSLSPGSAV
jgi:hypothetical protein